MKKFSEVIEKYLDEINEKIEQNYNNSEFIRRLNAQKQACNISDLKTKSDFLNGYQFNDLKFYTDYFTMKDYDIKIFVDCDLIFNTCDFKKIEFYKYKNPNTIDIKFNNINIHTNQEIELIINESEFSGKFIFDEFKAFRHKVNICKITYSIFLDNFEISANFLNKVEIHHCTFNKIVSFFYSKFDCELSIIDAYFLGMTNLENTIFQKKATIKYTTFSQLTQFREATFKGGLDLDRANLEKEVNFYGVKGLNSPESKRKTSQETYRIIKNQFENQNNKLDANLFHSYELEKRMIYLEKQKFSLTNYFEYFMLFYNYIVSKFSTNIFSVILSLIIIDLFLAGIMLNDSVSFFYIGLGLILITPLIAKQILYKEKFNNTRYNKISDFWNYFLLFFAFCTIPAIQFVLNWEIDIWSYILDVAILNLNLFGTPQAYVDYFKNNGLTMILNNGNSLSQIGMATYFLAKTLIGFCYYQFITTARKDTRK